MDNGNNVVFHEEGNIKYSRKYAVSENPLEEKPDMAVRLVMKIFGMTSVKKARYIVFLLIVIMLGLAVYWFF